MGKMYDIFKMVGNFYKLNLWTGNANKHVDLVTAKAETSFTVCHIGIYLYAIGGTTEDKCYNILTEKWSDLAPKMPTLYY